MRGRIAAWAAAAVAGAVLFFVALVLPFQAGPGPTPRVLDIHQGFRVWGSIALAPLGVVVVTAVGAWLLLGRWTLRRAAGLLVGAGLWPTLRGVSFVGALWFARDDVQPGPGSSLALAGGIVVLAVGLAMLARAPHEVGARSRVVCGLTLVAAVGYVLSSLVPVARHAPPGFEPSDLAVVNLSAPDATLVWEALLPAVITIVLVLASLRILTGTAGGTGAMLMALGTITALQFAGHLAWASSGAVEQLSPTVGGWLGVVTGALVFVTGLLSPAGPAEPVGAPAPAAA